MLIFVHIFFCVYSCAVMSNGIIGWCGHFENGFLTPLRPGLGSGRDGVKDGETGIQSGVETKNNTADRLATPVLSA